VQDNARLITCGGHDKTTFQWSVYGVPPPVEPRSVALAPDGSFALLTDRWDHTLRCVALRNDGAGPDAGMPSWQATPRSLNCPAGVALAADGTFALVTEAGTHVLRRLDMSSGELSTLAGSVGVAGATDGVGAAATFRDPAGVALAADGSFALVADCGNHAIRRVDTHSGEVTTVAVQLPGGRQLEWDRRTGAATAFYRPRGVALSADGRWCVVADTGNHALRRLELTGPLPSTGAELTTVAAGGAGGGGRGAPLAQQATASSQAGSLGLWAPEGLALTADGTAALVADRGSHAIVRVELGGGRGAVSTLAGGGGRGAPAHQHYTGGWGRADGVGSAAAFEQPCDVALSADGSWALVAEAGSRAGLRRVTLASGEVAAATPYGHDGADASSSAGLIGLAGRDDAPPRPGGGGGAGQTIPLPAPHPSVLRARAHARGRAHERRLRLAGARLSKGDLTGARQLFTAAQSFDPADVRASQSLDAIAQLQEAQEARAAAAAALTAQSGGGGGGGGGAIAAGWKLTRSREVPAGGEGVGGGAEYLLQPPIDHGRVAARGPRASSSGSRRRSSGSGSGSGSGAAAGGAAGAQPVWVSGRELLALEGGAALVRELQTAAAAKEGRRAELVRAPACSAPPGPLPPAMISGARARTHSTS
jgi:DNA-binding beta-propeller fold protein YncE